MPSSSVIITSAESISIGLPVYGAVLLFKTIVGVYLVAIILKVATLLSAAL